jgi:hypothetical protein
MPPTSFGAAGFAVCRAAEIAALAVGRHVADQIELVISEHRQGRAGSPHGAHHFDGLAYFRPAINEIPENTA